MAKSHRLPKLNFPPWSISLASLTCLPVTNEINDDTRRVDAENRRLRDKRNELR